jgi:hypothetical protein
MRSRSLPPDLLLRPTLEHSRSQPATLSRISIPELPTLETVLSPTELSLLSTSSAQPRFPLATQIETLSESNAAFVDNLGRLAQKLGEGQPFLRNPPEFSPLYTRIEDMKVDLTIIESFTSETVTDIIAAVDG